MGDEDGMHSLGAVVMGETDGMRTVVTGDRDGMRSVTVAVVCGPDIGDKTGGVSLLADVFKL